MVSRQSHVVTAANFAALGERERASIEEPEPHSLFDEVCFVEVLREAENAAEKVGADFHGRLADTPREAGRFLDDEHSQFRLLAQEQHRRRRAGQRAANDGHVVIVP